MKIIFLGTNGWYNTNAGNTTCIFIETEKFYIIFDAGDGFYKIGRFIKDNRPIYIFLSHFHLDHITGFHTLNRFNFPQGVKIYGLEGISELLNKIFCPPFSVNLDKLDYRVEPLELKEGRHNLPFPLECRMLLHSVGCFGYRIEIDNRVIAYCPDTGPCDNTVRLAKDADLVMCECSLKSGMQREDWPHLNPEMAANIAGEANAKRLTLIHFNPYLFPTLKDRRAAESQAKKIFPNTFMSVDDMEIQI